MKMLHIAVMNWFIVPPVYAYLALLQ